MAIIIKTDGTILEIEPVNGKDFKLEELNAIVNGYIEIVYLNDGQIMVVNEEGLIKGLPYNKEATRRVFMGTYLPYYIVGDVLVCNQKQVK